MPQHVIERASLVTLTIAAVFTFFLGGFANAMAAGQVPTGWLAVPLFVLAPLLAWRRSGFWSVTPLLGMLTVSIASALINQTPLWQAFVLTAILVFPLTAALLAASASSVRSRFFTITVIALWAVNVTVMSYQVVALKGVDRVVGVLNNDRASNSLAYFVLGAAIAFVSWSRIASVIRVGAVAVAFALAWLGDAKMAIMTAFVILVLLTGFQWIRVVREDRAVAPKAFLAATMIGAVCTALALSGVATESSIPLSPSSVRSQPQSIQGNQVANSGSTASTNLLGSGAGTGSSYLALLIVEGKFRALEARGVPIKGPADASLKRQIAENRGPGTGSYTSPFRTVPGVLAELGILGLVFYGMVLVVAVIMSSTWLPRWVVMSFAIPLLPTLLLTQAFEYEEVALGIVVSLLLWKQGQLEQKHHAVAS